MRGRLVPVGSPKQRALLATLALKAGSPVSNKDLAVAVWGCDQPEAPRRAVQLIVSRARTLLGGAAIVTCADGYLIEVRPERLDLGRFRYWLEQAEVAAGRSDPEMEAAALTEALAQWRDRPLAGIPSDFLEQQANQLVERRLRALERRFDVDLLLGRHHDLVSELMEMTTRHPLRERFWAQLMTALHHSGRRAEALEAYHTGRRHLVETLGIEPGEELRRLQMTVLGHGAAEPEVSATTLTVPRQLPSPISVFVGRRREIAELDRLTRERGPGPGSIVLISGTAGVGKTALALHWSRRVADLFPDGQLWADLRGYDHRPMTRPEQVLTSFLRALHVPERDIPPDLESRSALYRSLMDGRRALVVLDNARTAEQVRPLIPGSAPNTVVVTSRSRLTGLVAADGAQTIALDVFSSQDAGEMLSARLGADRIGAEPAATRRIVERCAHLPLALAVAAARLSQQPHQTLAAVADRPQALWEIPDEFPGPDTATDVRAVFSWSYRTLSEPAARLFRLMGVHPGTQMTAAALASLAAMPLDDLQPLLDELTGANLVTESATGHYGLHALLHVYAGELARTHDDASERRAALRRVLDHYLHTAYAAATLIEPADDPIRLAPPDSASTPLSLQDRDQALAWFRAEHTNLIAAIERAFGHGFETHAYVAGGRQASSE
ncbi:BTAD domain-containing putative transcriptional regulator [Nonomuraea sp. B10E15]|uniref:AfsR/SARP family transcriptional regulator n=1 Tax=Nonomuraea sp. B10E15 TaxID=3153560 RepID=UPI00325E63E6